MIPPKTATPSLTEALLTAALAHETALLATLQAGLQALAAAESPPHTPVEQEQDYDNLPV
ncbi:MAG: hypothetical protein H7317_05105 [Pseudorhodobacter sp.]|nr:hypothetical protein [Pseudorhodobacter sp.]